jgi:V8-like Glu-specific endopeptidase
MHHARHLIVAGVVLVGGCGGLEVDHLAEPIINGVTDSGHPAVGLLMDSVGSCTATLIGKHTVLSAVHCVTVEEVTEKAPPYTLKKDLYFTFASQGATQYPVASISIRSDFDGSVLDSTENSSDVAVVRLAQDITSVQPMLLATTAPVIGEAITIVGFGITATSDSAGNSWGTKRQTQNVIARDSTTGFVYMATKGGSICYGDSGGPTFAQRNGQTYQIGVHAYFPNEALKQSVTNVCEVGGLDARVDAYYSWIKQQAQGDLAELDVSPPRVAFISPTDQAVTGSTATAEVSAKDNQAIASVTLTVDGQSVGTLKAAPYQFQLTGLTAGTHKLKAVATDTAGLTAPAEISISVQVEDPSQQPSTGGTDSSDSSDPWGSTDTQGSSQSKYGPDDGYVRGGCSYGARPDRTPALPVALLLAGLLLARRKASPSRRPSS